ncbi:MAG: gliding motility-associated ABC transporter substrate-binding protein GldG [Crocinitomicaceae bacterium]|nr:gliding motility-associated ABC transporter substrate-binding protein GldG [Crocinitomicaceae bacterium]
MTDEKKKKYNPSTDILTHVGVIAIIFLVNYILSFSFGRFDLTEDKRYSLSDQTIDLLQNEERINDRIFFKVYLDGDLPADIKKIRNSIQEMLDEFIVYAGDNIQYEFIDPDGTDDEDYNLEVQNQLAQQGLQWCEIDLMSSSERKQQIIWPGAIIEYKGTTMETVQFFRGGKITNEQQLRQLARKTISKLEYTLVSAIRRVTAKAKKTISFLHGHGELHEHETKDVRKDLGEYYMIDEVEINGQIHALDNTDALIIAQPKRRFSEKDKFVIDQYIMRGGRVLWFVDPLTVPRDSLYKTGQTLGLSSNLNIEKDMIYKYGVRLNTDVIVDEKCGPLYIPQSKEIVDWYFYPLLEREEHLITSNIDPVRGQYSSSLDIVNESDKDVTKTVILKSSYNSRIFKAPARINYMITSAKPDFYDPTQGDFPVAVLLEGKFTSAFENRPISQAFLNSPDYNTKFKSDSTKMLVVADGDIIRNDVLDSMWTGDRWIYQFVPIHADMYGVTEPDGTPKYAYGNKDFVLNAVDYLLDDYSLIDIRTKSITLRKLNDAKIVEEKELWRFINIAIPLFALLILAGIMLILRKRKYATGRV